MLQSKVTVRIFSQDAVTLGHSEKNTKLGIVSSSPLFFPIVSAIHVRTRAENMQGGGHTAAEAAAVV